MRQRDRPVDDSAIKNLIMKCNVQFCSSLTPSLQSAPHDPNCGLEPFALYQNESFLERLWRALGSVLGAIIGLWCWCLWRSSASGSRTSRFLTSGNFTNLLLYNYHLIVAAVGATFVIITSGIDLSAGSTIALSSVACAYAARGFETPAFDPLQDASIGAGMALLVGLALFGRNLQRGRTPLNAAVRALGFAVLAGRDATSFTWWLVAGRVFGEGSALVSFSVGILTGGIVGLINGILVTAISLPPFIVTLGTLEAVRGLTLYVTNATPVEIPKDGIVHSLHTARWLGLPPNVWIAMAVVIIAVPLLHSTVLGRYTYAIGSNERTARLCGVRVERWKTICYLISGLAAGLAGVMMTAQFASAQPGEFKGAELDIIAAVVIGGTSLFGGEGTILGSVIGVLMLAGLHSGCNHANINPELQHVFIGGMIILAAAIDRFRHLAR